MLIGHWPLNGNANDYSGNNYNGTANSISYTLGKIGLAATYDGTTTPYISLPTATIQNITDFTFTFWAKYTGFSDRFILSVENTDAANYILIGPEASSVRIYIAATAYSFSLSSTTNVWYHWTIKREGSTLSLYRDGSFIASQSCITTALTANGAIVLGQEQDGILSGFSAAQSHYGQLNDFRIYDHALSVYEVKELAKAKILHYSFNDPYNNSTTNLIPNSPVNSYPQIGNSHGTYDTFQYNSNNPWSIGNIVSVSNNILTVDGTGRTLYTYDAVQPTTTGGGLTAGVNYFVKVQGTNQYSFHTYNSSQDGSQAYINETTGGFHVHYNVDSDTRISINSASFPTSWKGAPHLPNQSLVKQIVTDGFQYAGQKHDCMRLYTSFRNGDPGGSYMAYGVYPSVTAGEYYTFSFYVRAINAQAAADAIYLTLHTAGGWSSGTYGNYAYSLSLTYDWQKYEMTALAPNSGGTNLYFSGIETGGDIEIAEIQCERKYDATPFTVSSRTSQLKDLSGFEYNGTNFGNNYSLSKKFYKFGDYSFRGLGKTDSYIYNTDIPETTDALTYSCWAYQINKTITYSDATTTTRQFIMSHGRDVSPYGVNFVSSNGIAEVWYGGAAGSTVISSSVDLTTGWHHLAFKFIEGVGGYFFIDGTLVGSNTTVTAISYTNASGAFVLGKMSYSYTTSTRYFPFDGYIDDVRIYSTALSDGDIISLYKKRANLDNIGNISINEIDLTNSYFPPLIDYSTWVVGQTSATGWSRNGTEAENIILVKENPVNQADIMWATLGNDATSDADGGFNSGSGNIDRTKKYRYSVWIKRENLGNGRTYFGCGWSTVSSLGASESANGNPYFVNYVPSEKSNIGEQWVLLVAHVHPAGYTGGTDTDSGIYDVNGTKISSIATDYKWLSTSTTGMIRAYLFYSTSTTEQQYFYRPRIDLLDGTEPTLQDLITCADNPVLYNKTIADINKKALFNVKSTAIFRDIDEVSGTQNSSASQEITKNGTLLINGEFSEVD